MIIFVLPGEPDVVIPSSGIRRTSCRPRRGSPTTRRLRQPARIVAGGFRGDGGRVHGPCGPGRLTPSRVHAPGVGDAVLSYGPVTGRARLRFRARRGPSVGACVYWSPAVPGSSGPMSSRRCGRAGTSPWCSTCRDRSRRADVRDPDAVREALSGVDAVCHQAAMVGLGTGLRRRAGVRLPQRPRHGGAARRDGGGGGAPAGAGRVDGRVRRGPLRVCPRTGWCGRGRGPSPTWRRGGSSRCARVCGAELTPGLVGEDAPADPRNVYATTKLAQEHLAAAWARVDGRLGGVAALPQRVRAPACRATPRTRASPPSSAPRWPAARPRASSRTAASGGTSSTYGTWRRPTSRRWRRSRREGALTAYNTGSGEPHTVGEMAGRWPPRTAGPNPW